MERTASFLFIFFVPVDMFFSVFLFEQQFEIPEEEAEWVGLNLEEAVEKQRQLEHKVKHTHVHNLLLVCHSDTKMSVLPAAGAPASI